MSNIPKMPSTLLAFMAHFLKPYKRPAIIYFLLAFSAGFWGPFNGVIVKNLIDLLPQIQLGNFAPILWLTTLLGVNFIIFDTVTWRLIDYLDYRYQGRLKNIITETLMRHMLSGQHQFFLDTMAGKIASQIHALTDSIETILHKIAANLIRGGAMLVISLVTSYLVNPLFAVILTLWFICFAGFSLWQSRKLVVLADTHASTESIANGQMMDLLTNQSNIRIFAKKPFEIERMAQFWTSMVVAFKKKQAFLIMLYSIQGGLIALMLLINAYVLVYLYGQGQVTVGDFALILGLGMELSHIMWWSMTLIDDLNQAWGKGKHSLTALMACPVTHDAPHAQPLRCTEGTIEFRDVGFHYKGTTPLFSGLSITIKGGQKVGLVGRSGGGKTTFANLILRFYEPTSGGILIDGQNIRDVTQESLYHNIGMIPQEPSLFHRSLMDNIRYGIPDATEDQVKQAAEKAHADIFIEKLPQGYDALVGERGIKLSGGQRQRIAIARAILKNAPILLLDEATSQLDSITENLIQDSLWDLMEHKTTLVIAHRLSTLLHMDRILVFNKGTIVEDGTHAELLSLNGVYKTLWDAQVGGFLDDADVKE